MDKETVDVEKVVPKQGEVVGFSREAVMNPTPVRLKRWLGAIRYFLVTLILSVSGTDIFSGGLSKALIFFMGIGIVLTGAIEIGVGVKPIPDDDK